MDLTLTVRDYIKDSSNSTLRQTIWFEFANGKTASVSVTYSAGIYQVQSMNDSTFGWTTFHTLTPEQLAAYQSDEGIDLRVVRTGTTFDIYLDDTLVKSGVDLTKNKSGNATGITADMVATVSIRHYGNLGHAVDIPFVMTNADVVEMYNTELFYSNDKKTGLADPFVLDNRERDGYYYLYGTLGVCYCYRSTNLTDWEAMGDTIDKSVSEEISNVLFADIYAPEVVYDEDTALYYMFFSATPVEDTSVTGIESGTAKYIMLVATSKYPDKDFKLVDFTDENSCGVKILREYDKTNYPQYYAKYVMFDPASHSAFCKQDKEYGKSGGYIPAIDPHPYVDENGDKYLFWVDMEGVNRICVVKMSNWLTPDWSTAKVVVWANYYNQEDYEASKSWLTGWMVETVPYEENSNNCNEGPEVIQHNGKYYLTYSMGYYANNTYQVAQAVADRPMGPYRKLTAEEGAVMLSATTTGIQEVTGTGHHSFVTVGDKMYIIYHRHNDIVLQGGPRNHAIDEIQWITVKDKDGKDLDVMYVNGPTCTPQPKLEAFSNYKNIAGEAVISGASDTSYLTDGLLSVHKNANESFMEYIKETVINQETTLTFKFESPRAVSAIMVYNSKGESTCFKEIAQIELVCEENGKEVTRYFKNVEFHSDYYTDSYITPGAAAYVDFMEQNVTSVRITVEVPEGQDAVGISEVRILGK